MLQPDLYVGSLAKVPLEVLRRRGIRGLIVDLDNTVTGWNSQDLDEEVRAWFARLPELGMAACLSSNNGLARGEPVARALGIPLISNAGKPRRQTFRRALEVLGCGPPEACVIGDQLFTDVWGGKRLGLFTVLVRPVGGREFVGTRVVRQLEKLVMRSWGRGAEGESGD